MASHRLLIPAVAALLFMVGPGTADGQVSPCQRLNRGLREVLRGGQKTWEELHGALGILPPCSGGDCVVEGAPPSSFWATSMLLPSEPPGIEPEAWEGLSCRHSPAATQDADSATAWCEGVEGDGVGEVLALPWETSLYPGGSERLRNVRTQTLSGRLTGLRIWAGYGRSPALFRANGRPRLLHVSAVHANLAEGPNQIPQYGWAHHNLTVTDLGDVELRDVNGWQEVSFPAVPLEKLLFLALEIRSLYPGTRYHDTCVSGARLVTDPPSPRD